MKSTARKNAAVRMFEQAVRLALRIREPGMSGMTSGRLAANLRKYVGRLKNLARDDPDNRFWLVLQRAILKLVKYLRDLNR